MTLCQWDSLAFYSREQGYDIISANVFHFIYSAASIQQRAKGLVKFVRYNKVSLYRGSFPCI